MSALLRSEPRDISTELIDEPELAMRESFDDEKLRELEDSIRVNGLIERIVVRPKNAGRFEVIAGHRRLLACRRVPLLVVPCDVRDVAGSQAEALKVAENVDREDVNPAEEATYFQALLEKFCGNDTVTLADMVKRSLPYVEGRLLLLRGYHEVFALLLDGKIGIGVAQELNKFPDEQGVRMHLSAALNGATAPQMKQWRVVYTQFLEQQRSGRDSNDTTTDAAPARDEYTGPVCVLCREPHDMHRLMLVHVHDYCDHAILKPFLRHYHNDGERQTDA